MFFRTNFEFFDASSRSGVSGSAAGHRAAAQICGAAGEGNRTAQLATHGPLQPPHPQVCAGESIRATLFLPSWVVLTHAKAVFPVYITLCVRVPVNIGIGGS